MKKNIIYSTIFFALMPFVQLSAQGKSDFKVLKTFHIASSGGWDYIAVGPGNNRVYVSHGTQVNVLDKTTGDSLGVIENTTGVHGIAFDKVNNRGFTSNGRINNITVFDLKTNAVITQIATGENPDAILYDPFSKMVVTCNGRSKDLSIIDPVGNKVVATVAVGGKPETAVSNEAGKLYVNIEDKNEIVVVDLKTFTVEAHWPLAPAEEPTGLAIDRKTNRLFAGCGNKLLAILSTSDGKVIKTVPIGNGCDGAAFDAVTKNIFTSNGEGSLTVIHEKSGDDFDAPVTVTTKRGARTIAVDEQTHWIFLPTADFEQQDPSVKTRPKMIAGTFQVLVVGQ